MRSASVGPSTSSITNARISYVFPAHEFAMFGGLTSGEYLGFPLESCQPLGVVRERVGQNLDRDLAPRLVSVARHTSPMPPAPIRAVISYGPSRVPGANDTVNRSNYTGMPRGSGEVTSNAAGTSDSRHAL